MVKLQLCFDDPRLECWVVGWIACSHGVLCIRMPAMDLASIINFLLWTEWPIWHLDRVMGPIRHLDKGMEATFRVGCCSYQNRYAGDNSEAGSPLVHGRIS